MAEFIRAEDGRHINLNVVSEFQPLGRGRFLILFPGTDENGQDNCVTVSATEARRVLVKPKAAK